MTRPTTKRSGFLLLHRDGAVEHTETLTPEINQGLTVIDLDKMQVCSSEIEDDGDVEEEEEDDDPFRIQAGARRCFNPYVIWTLCTRGFR